jgi:hypothetical protein
MAISLDAIVSAYLLSLKDALTTGTDTGDPGAFAGDVHAAAQNYLRAQDLATALELLSDALDATTPLVVVSGSTTTIVDGVATFVAGEQVGNTVTMGTSVETIEGETAVVVSNTTTTLTLSPPFSATTTATDEYTIEATFLDDSIAALRDGKGIADATPGNPYGSQRNAIAGLMLGIETVGAATVAERNIGRAGLTSLVGSTDTVVILSDSDYRIDQFKGMRVVVTARGEGIVSSSNENSVTLRGPMAAAAQAADAVAITVPANDFGGTSAPKVVTHPGSQPGENAYLASLIDQFELLVEAATVPT